VLQKENSVKEKDIYAFSDIGFLLISATVIGAILRIYRVGYQSLWHDEVLTYLSSKGTLAHVLFQTEVKTNILPLYYLIVHVFLFLGEEDVILRIPSLIFGTLSIPLFFLVVRAILGANAAILASFFLAISPFHIFYSQEARPYALFLFLCLLALYLLQQCLNQEENHWLKFGFTIVAASTFYCHTAAIPFLTFLGFYVVLASPNNIWKKWGPSLLGLSILLIPALYRAIMIQEEGGPGRYFELSYLPYVLWTFSTGFSLGPTVLELHLTNRISHVIPYLPIIVPILLYISCLGLFGARELFFKHRKHFLALFLFFVLPLIFMSFAAIMTSRPFNVRHTIPSLLPFLIFLAYGIQNLNKKPLRIVAGGLFVAISIFSLTNYYFNDRYYRENSRGAGEFLTTNGSAEDLVICIARNGKTELQYYSSSGKVFSFWGYPNETRVIDPALMHEDLRKVIGKRDRFWVFYSRVFDADPQGHIKSYLDASYSTTIEYRSTGVELILYEIS
jgi:uncharacterized membrane protein